MQMRWFLPFEVTSQIGGTAPLSLTIQTKALGQPFQVMLFVSINFPIAKCSLKQSHKETS